LSPWGQLVYETTNADYFAGWDGTFEGAEQEMGTYVYVIDASFNNGEDFTTKGSFQLIR
jgi:hypothetical protein